MSRVSPTSRAWNSGSRLAGVGIELGLQRHDLLAHEPAHHADEEILLGGELKVHDPFSTGRVGPEPEQPRRVAAEDLLPRLGL